MTDSPNQQPAEPSEERHQQNPDFVVIDQQRMIIDTLRLQRDQARGEAKYAMQRLADEFGKSSKDHGSNSVRIDLSFVKMTAAESLLADAADAWASATSRQHQRELWKVVQSAALNYADYVSDHRLATACVLRERELLELKGPCSNKECRLHYAHSGPCNEVTAQ
jgi:hypothetical protein